MFYTPFPKEATLGQGLESFETSSVVGVGYAVSLSRSYALHCLRSMYARETAFLAGGLESGTTRSDTIPLRNGGLIRFGQVFRRSHGVMAKNVLRMRERTKPATKLDDEIAVVIK